MADLEIYGASLLQVQAPSIVHLVIRGSLIQS